MEVTETWSNSHRKIYIADNFIGDVVTADTVFWYHMNIHFDI